MVFLVGFMFVVVVGVELFIGNILMVIVFMDKKIILGKMLRNWGLVYFVNLVGLILLVVFVFYFFILIGDVVIKVIVVVEVKVNLIIVLMFLKVIFCNILVVLVVWMVIVF